MGRVRRDTSGTDRLLRVVEQLDGIEARVGYFETAKYEDGTPVAYVATIHEFGAPSQGIPPRPTMRPTIAKRKGEWARQLGAGMTLAARGEIEPRNVLDAVAQLAAADVRVSISQLTAPALEPATVRARQRQRADTRTVGNLTKPLVFTGIMLGSVSYQLAPKGAAS